MRLEAVVADEFGEKVKQAASNQDTSVMSLTRKALAHVVREPAPYGFRGLSGESFIRDLALCRGWGETIEGDRNVDAARDRLQRFERWSQDVAQFQESTSSASEIVPEGYRTAVTIPLTADRPLAAALETLPISNAAPFNTPTATGEGSVDAARAEGSQPASTEPTFGTTQVTPTGLAGSLDLTRELVDSASPGGDLVALQIMREDWQRQAEIRIYDELNASAGRSTAVSTPSSELYTALRDELADYAANRLRKARNVVAGGPAAKHLAGLINHQNGDAAAFWYVMGAAVNPSVNTFGTTTSDARVLILGRDDAVNYESELVSFRFDEAVGPALVRASVWGYHGVSVPRPVGVSELTF